MRFSGGTKISKLGGGGQTLGFLAPLRFDRAAPNLASELRAMSTAIQGTGDPEWWRTQWPTWRENLRSVVDHREIGLEWNFGTDQRERLLDYSRANAL
jgi:hypothetical protein